MYRQLLEKSEARIKFLVEENFHLRQSLGALQQQITSLSQSESISIKKTGVLLTSTQLNLPFQDSKQMIEDCFNYQIDNLQKVISFVFFSKNFLKCSYLNLEPDKNM